MHKNCLFLIQAIIWPQGRICNSIITLGNPSADVESYKIWSVNSSEVNSWLAILVKLLKSTASDTSSLVACEKLGNFLLANTFFFRYDEMFIDPLCSGVFKQFSAVMSRSCHLICRSCNFNVQNFSTDVEPLRTQSVCPLEVYCWLELLDQVA